MMGKKKFNCWEYYQCGREPGGKNATALGVCPSAADFSYNGINSGTAAGRFCWAISGTLCEGKVQGTFAQKRRSCQECDFFKTVLAEEGTLSIRTRFLRFLPPHTQHSILNNLRVRQFKQGEKLISQGEETREAYIIQRGSCLLTVEKQGRIHPVDHRNEGDILNMAALFTGEPAPTHIEAETDMEVWVLKKQVFEKIPREDPDLWDFLTEIVADRFDSRRPISDRTIGRYVATDIIGRGGYSIVYKGKDSRYNTPVAIKMMRHNMVKEADFLARFRREAQIVASLCHENIIKIYDTKERFKTAFIIMEYLEGISIAELIRNQGALDPDLVIRLLIQACGALDHALGQGILHKDINPENFMVMEDHLKLLDFGLACSIHDRDDIQDGAFPYLAPEILRGEIANISSEIYSLGTMAFEMVTGKRPYPEENAGQFVKLRNSTEIPDTARLVPGLPARLARFITKACRLDPDRRYKDMAEAGDVLTQGKPRVKPELMGQSNGGSNGAADRKSSQEDAVMTREKLNCWEFMNCGRGPGSTPSGGCDQCPATKASPLDGFNQGIRSGRACWLVAGTFCNQEVAGTYAAKKNSCMECDFYRTVNKSPGETWLSIENVDVFAFTHPGLTKRINEDRYLIRQMKDKSLLLAVADGLGGDVGSDYAAEIVKAGLVNMDSLTPGREREELSRMAQELDQIICDRAESDPSLEAMATTLVCAVLKNDHVHWLNVGDSRLYIFRDHELIQVTEDQTLAKFLVDEGELTPEQARDHYSYEILDQCVGYGECRPETATFKVQQGDILILSTDGLYKMVPQKKLLSILNAPSPIREQTRELVKAALDFGGKDNITIVMAKINITLSAP